MKLKATSFGILALLAGVLFSCKEKDDSTGAYAARNAEWFLHVADTARAEIAKAKQQYGNKWEEHCSWRMYKNVRISADAPAATNDSIVCKVCKRGTGTEVPWSTDSVDLHFRGWLAPEVTGGSQSIFTQTYFGNFDPNLAAAQKMSVAGTVPGFQTALQHMVAGDDWFVYIPSKLGYNEDETGIIPANSTLMFRIYLTRIYKR